MSPPSLSAATLLEQMSDAYFELDQEWRITYWNEAMEKRTGYDRETVVGEVIWERFPEFKETIFEEYYRRVFETGEPAFFETKVSSYAYKVEVRVYPTENGIAVYSVETTRKKEQERRLSAVFDASHELMCVLRPDGTLIEANQVFEDLLEVERDTAIGHVLDAELLHAITPKSQKRLTTALKQARTGELIELEVSLMATGERKTYDVSMKPYFGDEGDVVYIIVEGHDVTDKNAQEAALRHSADLFERVQRMASIGAWEIDMETREMTWTDELKRIHELPLDYEPTLEEAISFIHEDDQARIRAAVERAFENGENWDIVLRVVTQNNSLKWIRLRGEVQKSEQGRQVIRGTFQDITASQEARDKLKESEAAMRELTHISADSSLPFEEKLDQLLELGCEWFGLDIGILSNIEGDDYTVVGAVTPDGSITPGTTFDLADTFCNETIASDEVISYEQASTAREQCHPAYEAFGLESYIGTSVVVDNEPFGTVNFSSAEPRERPFTKSEETFVQLLAEWIGYELRGELNRDRLESSRERLRTIIDTVPHAIFVKTYDGEYLLANEAASALFGLSPEELVGKSDEDILDAEIVARVAEIDQHVIDTGTEILIEGESVTLADGSEGIFKTRKLPITMPNTEEPCLLGVAVDITPLKQAEKELREANASLTEYKEELEIRFAQLEFFDSLLRHDVLNGMTVIRGSAEFLLDDLEDEQNRFDAETILEWADDIVDLVDRVRTMLAVLSGEEEPALEPVDVESVLEAEVGRIKSTYPQATLTVESTPVYALADDMLQEIIGNILTNAIRHGQVDTPSIEVSVKETTNGVRIEVTDNGIGVPDDKKEVIFRRGETSHVKTSGSGFGLFFCETMISAYDGRIWVEDAEPHGAKFVIELPQPSVVADSHLPRSQPSTQ
ncbi:PAS domain-containing protein [Haladaptatus sp. DJG-WS-42]|uniref:PAS domain-containing protein n=1 Tax=Haladaptatus sp. DJG-WS-42 TaxID=3120516 RepID=UPI0030CDE2F2